jgi:hypothetical protein
VEGNIVADRGGSAPREVDRRTAKSFRSERYMGTMSRAFTLPMDVDVGHAEAKYADGVLMLTLPKLTGTPAHRLPINCSPSNATRGRNSPRAPRSGAISSRLRCSAAPASQDWMRESPPGSQP